MRTELELMEVERATSIETSIDAARPNDITPLHGHESPETAYVVDDYPYGYRLRCKIRYWVEYKPKKGYRFCSQTTNPKVTGDKWNRPKCDVYQLVAMCMYKDNSDGHINYSCASEYTSAEAFLEFVRRFAEGYRCKERLIDWSDRKAHYLELMATGKAVWTVNGIKCEPSEADLERYRKERFTWLKAKQIADGSIVEPAVPYQERS